MLNVALRPRLAVVLLAGVLAASLTACGGKEAASAPTPAAQSSTTPSLTPTPTPTPRENGAGGKYGELTLVVRRPAKAKANTTAALASFQAVHESFAAMAANGQKAPAEMSDVATPEVITWLSGLLDPQRKLKEQAGGTLRSARPDQPGREVEGHRVLPRRQMLTVTVRQEANKAHLLLASAGFDS